MPNFAGNAEGGDVMAASFDIFVCDGFTGNVCLKTIEGTAKQLFKAIKGIMMKNLATKVGALTLAKGIGELRDSVDPDTFGGAPLLGVKGSCIIGHGSSSELGILNGIAISAKIARSDLNDRIAAFAAAQKEAAANA